MTVKNKVPESRNTAQVASRGTAKSSQALASQNTASTKNKNSSETHNNGNSARLKSLDSTNVSREARASGNASGGISGLISGVSDWAQAPTDQVGDTPSAAQPETPAALELGDGELLSRGRGNPERITQLQEMLNAGGGQLEVDGKFGPRTAEAVRNFQRENGLTVDGVVGPQTLAALNGDREESASPQETGQPAQGTDGTTETRPPAEAAEAGPDNPSAPSTTRLQGIPDRPEGARGGREFMDSIAGLPPGPQRDQAVLQEILSGNIPENSRNLQELVVNRDGREIRMNVMSDYLAIGSDEDNVRIPMTPAVAQAIADRTGTSLPTDRIVDDIHGQARQLHMAPMSNDRESIGTYGRHDQRIDDQLGSGVAPTELVSGHKKDLVIPHRDGRVAIYGGRWPNGGRIQDYSNVHHDGYEDYSHGARLISQAVTIDGQTMRLADALADPALASLFTNHRSGSFSY